MQHSLVRYREITRWFVLSLAMVTGVSCATGASRTVASIQEEPQNVTTSDAAAAPKISVGLNYAEVINIRVPEYRTLSGEYRIGADGTIALPGIGRLNVAKLTSVEFERHLRNVIYRVSNRETNVAIEVATYRPFYVSGAVARAGSFQWRPGLSVMHAQALAGGIYRGPLPGQPVVVNPSNSVNNSARNTRAAFDLAAALATIERLRTERKGGTVFTTPKRLAKLVSANELERLAARQQTLLNSRKAAYDARVRALQNTKTLTASEKSALEMQRVRINEQLASRKALRERVMRLTEQGYSRADRVFEEQVRVAQLEERLTTTTLGISRMALAEAAAEQDLEAFTRGRAAEIDLELLDLEQRVGQLEIQLRTVPSPDNRDNEPGNAGGVPEVESDSPKYEIIRVQSGENVVLKADRTTALRPGDVLVVM